MFISWDSNTVYHTYNTNPLCEVVWRTEYKYQIICLDFFFPAKIQTNQASQVYISIHRSSLTCFKEERYQPQILQTNSLEAILDILKMCLEKNVWASLIRMITSHPWDKPVDFFFPWNYVQGPGSWELYQLGKFKIQFCHELVISKIILSWKYLQYMIKNSVGVSPMEAQYFQNLTSIHIHTKWIK